MKKQLLFLILVIIGVIALNNIEARDDNYTSSRTTRRYNNENTTYRNGPLAVVGVPVSFAGRVVEGTGDVISGKETN